MPELVALQARLPQFDTPFDVQGKALQLRQLMNANQASDMELAQRRQAMADEQAARSVFAENPEDAAARLTGLAKVSPGAYSAEAKRQSDLAKTAAETRAKQITAAKEKFQLMGQSAGYVRDNPTLDNALRLIGNWQNEGLLTAEQASQYADTVRKDPTKIQGLATEAYQSAIDAEKQLPKIEMRNIGGQDITYSVSPITGQVRTLNTVQRTLSPSDILQAETSRQNNAATVAASRENAAATRAIASATRDAASIQRDKETEMKMADDYRAQAKSFKEVKDAYNTINGVLDKATKSPVATLAAATKVMKLLDPGSVVRESELGMALQATGALDRMTNYFNTLQRGKVLTQSQVDDFKGITQQIYNAAKSSQQDIDENYRQQAETYGLRPGMIIQDLGQGKKPKAAAPAPALPAGWSVSVEP